MVNGQEYQPVVFPPSTRPGGRDRSTTTIWLISLACSTGRPHLGPRILGIEPHYLGDVLGIDSVAALRSGKPDGPVGCRGQY